MNRPPRQHGGRRFSAVLFDLDGTLLDTLADLGESMNEALAKLGFPGHSLEEYRRMIGDGVVELARRALPPAARDEATVASCAAAMRRVYARRWSEKTRPYPGVPEMLDRIAVARLPMAILSNKPDEFTQAIVERLLPRWKFAAVVGAREGIPRKPDPTAAFDIARRTGIEPQEWLYVGDTGTDMRAARAAGMFAAGALWGFRDAEELERCGAHVLLERPEDVVALLEPA
ncbi:MAG: HAD family hydrolase [Candidatus Dadabacteria bacterium]|nr:MAG: HAD family hydrolase [Candidatus Dadabacteria bacterium]